MKLFIPMTLCLAALAGCSSSSNDDTTDTMEMADVNTVLTGTFNDSVVAGLAFSTATQSGVTNAAGEFTYLAGETLTLSLGDLVLPDVLAAESLSPLDLYATTDISDTQVVNLSRLLQSLDMDGDTANGIEISESATASTVSTTIDFTEDAETFGSNTDVINLVANSGSSNTDLVSIEEAISHLQQTLINTGDLEALDKVEYTNLISGKTVDFLTFTIIYYREDGVKFSRRSNGEEFVGTWTVDANGQLCEDFRGGPEVICVADAENFNVSKHPDSGEYFFSQAGFQSRLTIAEGDVLNLSGEADTVMMLPERVTAENVDQLFDIDLFLSTDEGLSENFITVRADGTFDGTWEGEPIAATWEIRDDFFCRTLTEFFIESRTGEEDCQLWEKMGDTITAARDRGMDGSFMYTLVE